MLILTPRCRMWQMENAPTASGVHFLEIGNSFGLRVCKQKGALGGVKDCFCTI